MFRVKGLASIFSGFIVFLVFFVVVFDSAAIAGPDLVLTAVTTTTIAAAPGGALTVSATVRNQGDAAAGSFIIAFHLSTNTTFGDGDDVVITGTGTVSSLAAGASKKAVSTLTIPPSAPVGTYHLCAMADSGGAVAESNESNNTFCTDGTGQVTEPDLVLMAVTPTTAAVSSKAALSVVNTVKNQGGLPAGSFLISFNLSPTASYTDPGAVAIQNTQKVSSLAVGASRTATTKLSIPLNTPAGSYYVCAKADSADAVAELNEANDTQCSASPVIVPASDLILTTVSTKTTVIAPGKTLSVSSTAKNQGGFPAGGFAIAFHLSTNTTYGDGDDVVIAATRTVSSLAAGASSKAANTLTVPGSTPVGTYHLCAKADAGTAVPESDETNNVFCTSDAVQVAKPDLVLTSLSTTNTAIAPGKTLSVSNTVKNEGSAEAGGFAIAFHLSTNTTYGDGDDVMITATRAVKSLAVGATSPASTKLGVPLNTPAGSYYICAKADAADAVVELNETNNAQCAITLITVSSGGGNPGPDEDGTLLFSIHWDDGFILWHKTVVSEDGDAMALWDVANAGQNVSAVWASYYSHSNSKWGQAQKITNNDIVSYFSMPEAKFDENGAFVVANTGNNLSGFSTWWNRFEPGTGWGMQRTLPDGRDAFGVNTRGEIFSQNGSKQVARYDTSTGILTPDFTASENFGSETTMAFANLNGELLEASAHFGITATKLVVSLFSYTPAGGWAGQVDTPVLTYANTTGMIPLQTAVARDGSGHIAVVVAGKSCNPSCNITTHGFVAAIYFDGANWGAWKELDSSDASFVVQVSAPSVKIDDQGRAVAFWSNSAITLQPKLRAAAYSPGSGWGMATNINSAGSSITSGPNYPGQYTPEDAFTMNGNGDAIVSWMDQVSGFRIRENRFHPATGWVGETPVRNFPPAMVSGAKFAKAQVNSTGKGFRTWVRVPVDLAHPLVYTDELRVEPITTP